VPEPKPIEAATLPATPAATNDEKPKPKNPVEITFEGINRRLRLLTPIQIDGRALCISPDSRDLIFRAYVTNKPNLWTLPLDEPRAEQPLRQITASGTFKWAAQFAPDGKSFWFLDGGQIVFRKFPIGDQVAPQFSGEVQIHLEQEKWQIFNECWTNLRDHFYDANFRGLDWHAIREQYRPLIAGCQTNHDLVLLLNLMMGELNTSHLGIGGGGGGGGIDGYIGLFFDRREQHTTGRLVVVEVLPEGPAALAGITVGSELLAVEGRAITGTSLDALLQRTIGRRVRLRITGPAEQAEREVIVRPVTGAQYYALRYHAWVQANEAIVHAASGGQLGYVHIPEMSYDAYQQFLVDLDAETYGKQGVLIDVRYNGGGHTATFFVDVLTRRSVLLKSFRSQTPSDAGHLAGNRVLNRPTVLVTNERSFSNAEMFAEAYRHLAVGKVVGRPTGGAVISTWQPYLLNGLSMGLPRMRVTTLDGEDLEGIGRPVDVDVALPLGDPGRGRDPQLERAVRVLLEQIQ
jgi:C-terminal processing protease CtpA/Prc